MNELLQDLRFALRQAKRSAGIALAVVLVLALGIAANAVTFTVLKATLLNPLPYLQPERLVQLFETRNTTGFSRNEFSYPDFADYREKNQVFESLGGFSAMDATLQGPQGAEQVHITVCSANLFDVLGVKALLGRGFQPDEDAPGAERKAMLTYAGWQRRYSGDPNIIGKTAVVNDEARVIVGVLPRDFQFAPSRSSEFWLPYRISGWRERRNAHWLFPVGRLKAGISFAQAQASLSTLAAQLSQQYPDSNHDEGVLAVGLREQFIGPVRPVILLLMAAMGCYLLITCGNLAGLLLSQAVGRQKEMSIRLSLGAGRGRIVRQLLTESCALSVIGGLAGVCLSLWLLPAALGSIPKEQLSMLPALEGLHVDWGFLLIALCLAVSTGILFGLAPALLAFRPQLRATLEESGRSSGGVERHRLRDALVIAEISMAIVLLHAGGLMLRSLSEVMNTNPGFRADHLLTLELTLPMRRYPNAADEAAMHQRLLETLSALPGVHGVGTSSTLPLTGGRNTSRMVREGHRTPGETESQEANSRDVSTNYFSVMGIPLRAGRLFNEHDGADAPHVVLINQTLADRLFPGEDPVGKRIDFTYTPEPNLWEVVGVVGDENSTALDAPPNPVIYSPFTQSPDMGFDVVVRTNQAPENLGPAMVRAIREIDPAIPVYDVQSMDRLIGESPSIFLRRSPAYLIAAFGALGLLLAAVGLYSLLAYTVTQRKRELGIRMALGAQRSDVLSLILGSGMRLALAGIALGLVLGLAISRVMVGFLYQVQPGDPFTAIGVCVLLLIVALAATGQPAWRAAAADPMHALREE